MAADRAPVLLPDGRRLRGAQCADEINIADYLPLCRKLAWKWVRRFDSVEDAVQVAMIGLCKARDRWDPARGPFEAIASLYIRSEFKVEARKQRVRAPLNLPATRINADGEELDLTELLADDSPDAEQVLIERDESYPRQRIAEALASLDGRERGIIEARYLADEPALLRELSKAMGLSVERIRQIEVKALKLIREVITGEAVAPPLASAAVAAR